MRLTVYPHKQEIYYGITKRKIHLQELREY